MYAYSFPVVSGVLRFNNTTGRGVLGIFKVQVFWNMTPSKLVKVTDFSEDLTFCVFRVYTANNEDSDCVVSEDVGSKHF
jgi:hypothetical protein